MGFNLPLLNRRRRGGEAVPPIITATLSPAQQAMFDGDTISDVTNFATLDDTANYSSTAGTITSVEWLVNGTDQAGSYVLSAGQNLVVRVTDSATNTREWTIDASVAAVVPAQFGTGDWSLANDGVDVTLTVTTLPDDGGSALTDLEYRVNSGSAVSLGATATGDYTITAAEADDIEIRAINAVGAGPWSASKAVPAASGVTYTEATGGTEADIVDPVDGLAYTTHTFTTGGTFTITVLGDTPDIQYLIVGGGGAGGYSQSNDAAAGGGAGGMLTGTMLQDRQARTRWLSAQAE